MVDVKGAASKWGSSKVYNVSHLFVSLAVGVRRVDVHERLAHMQQCQMKPGRTSRRSWVMGR